MNKELYALKYGNNIIDYTLSYCDRKTLGIAVYPDKSVIIKAPLNANISKIEKKLHKRASWIQKQIKYFHQFQPKTPKRLYMSGETHLYLGKRYRMKIVQEKKESVKLNRGFLHVGLNSSSEGNIIKLVENWYYLQAEKYFGKILNEIYEKFKKYSIKKPVIIIKKLKSRWGSCIPSKNRITINLELMKTPKECIEYIILHELSHLKHLNHNQRFYNFLDYNMPDWKERKEKLEKFGIF